MGILRYSGRRAAGGKAGNQAGKLSRRLTQSELNQQARERKRQRKRRGNPPGSRANPALSGGDVARVVPVAGRDPRLGSTRPVPLVALAGSPVAPVFARQAGEKPPLTAAQELARLENDERLNCLLDRLEAGERLSAEDEGWVRRTLSRAGQLMAQLGIGDEDEMPPKDDVMRLLRGR